MEALRYEIEGITLADPRQTENTKPLEEVALISIHSDFPNLHVMIETKLSEELQTTLVEFLKKNYDIFIWS